MIGKELSALEALEEGTRREAGQRAGAVPFLQADQLGRKGSIHPLDLTIHPGEVVGLTGLLGSGRSELARLLHAADRADSGTTSIDGRVVELRTTRARARPEDRLRVREPQGRGTYRRPDGPSNIVLAMQAARG